MGPTCSCCASITGRPPTPADYWWTGPNGHPTPVCEDCAGWWLINALEDDWLTPRRVEPLEAAR